MSIALKKLAGQTALYGLSSIIGRTVNFLLVPVLTQLLLPPAFGTMTYLYAYAGFLNIIYLYGLETGYFRFAKKEGVREEDAFSVSFSSLLLTTSLFTLLFLLLNQPIAQLILQAPDGVYVILLALILATDSLAALPFARLRWQSNALTFALLKLASIFLNIGFTLLFLGALPGIQKDSTLYLALHDWIFDDPVSNILLANLLANIFPFLFFFPVLKSFRFTLRKDIRKDLIAYCIPLLWMGLAGMVNELLDRIVLGYLLPDNFYPGESKMFAIGVYGACYKLSMFMSLAIQAFRYAADPFFFSRATDKHAPELFSRVMTWFVLTCLFIFTMVSIFLPYFGLLLRHAAYREGLFIVPYLLMANLFLGVYYNLSMWYKLTDRTVYGTYLSIGGATITLLGNILLIPFIGYFGSALTTLACYFLMAFASWYFGQKFYPIPYRLVKIFLYILWAIFLVISASFLSQESIIADLAVKTGIFVLYPLSIYMLEIKKIQAKLS